MFDSVNQQVGLKKISVSESDIDLNEHFKNFSDVYFSQLSPKELALINRKSYSSETRKEEQFESLLENACMIELFAEISELQ